MNIEETLTSKTKEVQHQLTEWACRANILKAGQQIRLTLEVVSVPIVSTEIVLPGKVPVVRKNRTGARTRARNTDLTEEDWMKIATPLHFSRHLPALEFLKKQGNRPVNLDQFPEFDWLRVNTILNKAGLPYRIVLANRVTPCDDPAARVMAK